MPTTGLTNDNHFVEHAHFVEPVHKWKIEPKTWQRTTVIIHMNICTYDE